jgi:stress response protein YsnF
MCDYRDGSDCQACGQEAIPSEEQGTRLPSTRWLSLTLRGSMADPVANPSTRLDDQEPVPVLDDALRSAPRTVAEEIIPVVEESATIGKREVVTGHVRVRTVTDTVEELTHASVQREDVEVTRVPIDRVVETAPEIRIDGDVTIVPVLEEVLVLKKRLVLKEELHIRRRVETEAVEVPVTLRKQRAVVERESQGSPSLLEEGQNEKSISSSRADEL